MTQKMGKLVTETVSKKYIFALVQKIKTFSPTFNENES